MKKITFVLSAVLVALTLNAQELRLKEVVASRAADVFAPMSTITLEKGNAVLDKQAALSMKKLLLSHSRHSPHARFLL